MYSYTDENGTIIYTNERPGKAKRARKLKGTFTQTSAPQRPVTTPRARVRGRGRTSTRRSRPPRIRYKIPESLVRAVVHVESNFNPQAVSHKGASGLMQLMPATAADMYVKDIFDVRENIEGGVRYLRVLANHFDGDMVKMIAAYNAGPEAVKKYGGTVPPYAETQGYVRKVVKLYFQYKQQAGLPVAGAQDTASE